MKNEIVANSCRVCLTETKKLRSLYKPLDEGDEPPNKMLYLITGIEVEKLNEHETLPKNICKNCELALSMAFEFRENALKTQQIIVAHLNQMQENDSSALGSKNNEMALFKNEFEDIMNLEPLDCVGALEGDIPSLSNDQRRYSQDDSDDMNESISGDNMSDDDELCSEQNVEDLNDSKENYTEHEENNENEINNENQDSRMNDYENEGRYTEEHVEIEPAVERGLPLNPTNLEKSKSIKRITKSTSKTSTKIEKTKGKRKDVTLTANSKLIPRRGRKPSNNTNQNGHICDICGNVFAKRGRMMEHRQRHDKECRYCCEICDQKFLTRELLRKHMFSHSGGKPLKCEFCSRTFYYESVRKAHESVHKGHRPYVCNVCGKNFSYAHSLKKHELIHAEIKLYRCEYCNKDFRLQHHMKQHELTKLHQNAVHFAKKGNISIAVVEVSKAVKNENEEVLYVEDIVEDDLSGDN